MDGKRREEREQAEYKPKEEKAHGYEPRQQSRTYREFVNLRKANEQAENKRKEQAESEQKDEKARVSEYPGISPPFLEHFKIQEACPSSIAPKACTSAHCID